MRRRDDTGSILQSIMELCRNLLRMLSGEREDAEHTKARPRPPNRWAVPEGIHRKALAREQKVIDDMLKSSSYIKEYAKFLHAVQVGDNANSQKRVDSLARANAITRGMRGR